MNISPGMVVPPALVLAVSGWSCWTIVGASTAPAAAAKPKPAEGAGDALEADLGPPTPRDPFSLPGEAEAAAMASKPGAAAKPAEPPEAKVRRALADLNKKLAARLAAVRAAEAKRAAARERIAKLPLTATSIQGRRRAAIIGGRAYAEGETLEGTDASLGPVVLGEVRAREVTLRSSAGPVAVKFAETTAHSPSAPAPSPRASSKPARPRVTGGVVTIRGKAR
jgi:hypothetical protein